MIEKLKKKLLHKFDYELTEYALYKPPYTVGIPMIISMSVFVVLSGIMAYEVFTSTETFMNFPIFMFALVVLVLVPLALKSTNRYYAIIATPRFIIQRCGKKEFTILNYNHITSFSVEKEGIVIKEGKDRILLSVNLFKEEMDPIIDILEAKGKTFDKSKDYMIRPITIVINKNKIEILEADEEGKITSELYGKYVTEYPALTPGFLDQLTFRNAVLENTTVNDKNVVINLSKLVVREDHPENTSFGQMLAQDCIIIIENIRVDNVIVKGYENLVKKDLVDMVLASNDATTITQIKYVKDTVEADITVGVQACKIVFGYQDVFVGWKHIKKLSK